MICQEHILLPLVTHFCVDPLLWACMFDVMIDLRFGMMHLGVSLGSGQSS
jgi:hypothetical protein